MPPFRRSAPVFALAAAVLAAMPAQAQEGDLAERLYRSGERAFATKSYPEAMDTWTQLVQTAPKSDYAPQALLQMAQYQASIGKVDAAMPLLDKLKADYLSTRWAAPGLLLRGQILAGKAKGPDDLKEAIAEFNRVLDLFPASDAAPQALVELGRAALVSGDPNRALGYLTEAYRAHPDAPVAPAAMLEAAQAMDARGDLEGALRLLERVKLGAPDSSEAKDAAWRLTALVRLRLLKPPFKVEGDWPKGQAKWLHTPTLLALDPAGRVLVYQKDLGALFRLEPVASAYEAKALPLQASDPIRVLFSSEDQPQLLTEEGLVTSSAAPVPLAGLTHIRGAVRDRWNRLWIADTKVQGFTILPPAGPSRVMAGPALDALTATRDGMAGASNDARKLLLFTSEGKVRKEIPFGQGLPAPYRECAALAADPLGNLAVLTSGGDFGEGVVVYGPDGAVLRQARFRDLGLNGRFVSLVLDRAGGIILADRRNDSLIRLD
ncbi:MAG: tetratricopeptide repeat protein [Acidobacteria bacterium]|nr:tetratricopeptide repeat protein [Acidobacteriota bacterium]